MGKPVVEHVDHETHDANQKQRDAGNHTDSCNNPKNNCARQIDERLCGPSTDLFGPVRNELCYAFSPIGIGERVADHATRLTVGSIRQPWRDYVPGANFSEASEAWYGFLLLQLPLRPPSRNMTNMYLAGLVTLKVAGPVAVPNSRAT